MLKKGFIMTSIALCGLGWVTAASAQNMNQVGGKFGFFGNAGISSYMMTDINDEIGGILWVDPSAKLEKIYGGANFNGGVHYAINDNLLIGVAGGMLTASGSYAWDTYLGSYKNEINLPATEVGVLAKYMLPLGTNMLVHAGLEVGLLQMSGVFKNTYQDFDPIETTATGSTVDVKVMAGGQLFLAPAIALGIDLGYRMAKITEIKDGDGNVYTDGDDNISIDYSGLVAQAGLRFYF